MTMKTLFPIFSILFLLVYFPSCGKKKSKSRYNGYVPSFSVVPPVEGSSGSSLSSGLAAAHLAPSSIGLSDLVVSSLEDGERVDCAIPFKNLSDAPSLPSDSSSLLPANASGYVVYFYAMAQFYDCNLREQLQSDGITRQCPLREGTGGSVGDEDLCDEDADTSVEVIWAKLDHKGGKLKRFVGWSIDTSSSETSDIEGLMLNLYDEPENSSFLDSKTRIDLKRTGEKKEVDAVLLSSENYDNKDVFAIIRVFIKESGSGNPVENNYIIARHWHKNYQKVLTARIHIKADTGIVVYHKECAATTFAAALTSTCTASDITSGLYFNLEGSALDTAPSGLAANGNDSNFASSTTGDRLDSFIDTLASTDAAVDEYFNSDSYSPSNN